LMALKPDVTLSIVKNTRDCGSDLQKIYYSEKVYRAEEGVGFCEFSQVGVELMGELSVEDIAHTILLAAMSLQQISDNFILELSNLDILSAVVSNLCDEKMLCRDIFCLVEQKNVADLMRLCEDNDLDTGAADKLIGLLKIYGTAAEQLPKLEALMQGLHCETALAELKQVISKFAALVDKLWLDFSSTDDLGYYNGFAFKAYVKGLAEPVLSGGQYDKLMQKMHRKDRAIGFAIFLNSLERLEEQEGNDA
ncbi:MAG: ATP phosphoribosyltransferase regulatory subunit, partial [Eggerthellaceae bacterium]|nr:ATP phosphoribosyltransferase regulatory subunit [Eggerthellaceae bacterium]